MTFACAAALLTSCARLEHLPERVAPGTRAIYDVRYAAGDEPDRASPSFDDSAWADSTTYDLPDPTVTLWLRTPVTIGPGTFEGRTAGLFISAVAACDVFWDGRFLGTTREIDHFMALSPSDAAAGAHLLALRVRANEQAAATSSWFYGIGLGDYRHMVESRARSQIIPMLGAGAFSIAGAWYLAMWVFLRRRASILVFAVLCFTAAALDVAEAYRALFGYGFEWHIVRLRVILLLTFAVSVLLPLFLALEMQMRRPLVRLAAFAPIVFIAALGADSYDGASVAAFSHSVIACMAVVGTALPRRRWDALPAALGVAVLAMALATGGYRFGDRGFFVAFTFLILCLLLSLSIDLGREQRQHYVMELRAARLEAELLKKSIQPHFLMNTLTAVMEWMEERPREGVRFLESLAEELRIFLDVGSRPLIPVEKELALCRAHLRIMSCRKGAQFSLETDGIGQDGMIPPAIFHTLVENAISHNFYDQEVVSFTLREDRHDHTRRFVFSAPLRTRRNVATGDGVGMRYVKARLEESYPGRWRVESFSEHALWRTAIEVPA